MTDIPISLSGVTAEWLQQQFHNAGHEDSEIISLDHAPMEGFTGAMGEVGIFTIEWKTGADSDLPNSFVAKCPLDDDIARLYNDVMQYYVRESGFYADLVHQIDMRIPKCWINRFDHETGRAFLLLE